MTDLLGDLDNAVQSFEGLQRALLRAEASAREAVLSVLADGGWRRGDGIHAAVLPVGHSRHDSLSVSLCLDALAIARREVDMRKVERDGLLIDFEFRLHREPVQKTHTLEDFA